MRILPQSPNSRFSAVFRTLLAGLLVGSCSIGCGRYRTALSAPGREEIVRSPPPTKIVRGPFAELPRYDPEAGRGWQVDVRGADLRRLDLGGRMDDLRHADFDSRTQWPERLPPEFAPEDILGRNRNPGLGVRKLHARGVTGRGVGIGVIDQALLTGHCEYRERLRVYEEIHVMDREAQMHGAAVASIAVGASAGVAPGADLYYIAETHGRLALRSFEWDFTWRAAAIDRMVAINAQLPAERRIRVVAISVGWSPERKGGAAADAALARARAAGIFVISTALERTYGLAFHGLGRDLLADPDDFGAHRPGSWWARGFNTGQQRFPPGRRLLVPMDSRAVASPTGVDDYVFYSEGGWSWSVPWLAGLYALACEVRPDVTPEQFWREALATGRTITYPYQDGEITLGTLADPEALINRLQRPVHAPGSAASPSPPR